jgi:hypothetical protein
VGLIDIFIPQTKEELESMLNTALLAELKKGNITENVDLAAITAERILEELDTPYTVDTVYLNRLLEVVEIRLVNKSDAKVLKMGDTVVTRDGHEGRIVKRSHKKNSTSNSPHRDLVYLFVPFDYRVESFWVSPYEVTKAWM